MAFIPYYKDPSKKTLQIIEIVAAIIFIAVVAVLLPPKIKEYKDIKTAIEFCEQGHNYLHQNNDTGAAECFKTAIRIYPQIPSAYLELGSIYYFNADLAAEEAIYREGLKNLPNNADLHQRLIEHLYLSGRYDEAVKEAENTLKLYPKHEIISNIKEHAEDAKANPDSARAHNIEQHKKMIEMLKKQNVGGHQHNSDEHADDAGAQSSAVPAQPGTEAQPAAEEAPARN